MKHIHIQLVNYHDNVDSQSRNMSLTVYRGKTMSTDEFNNLFNNSTGGFLCSSGFIVANRDKNVTIDFLRHIITSYSQRIAVLLEIHIDPTVHTASSFTLLDGIDDEYQSKTDDICFTFSTIFCIESIKGSYTFSFSIWVVKLVLADDSDPQLFRFTEPIRSSEAHSNPLAYFGKLSIDMDNLDQAEKLYLQLLLDKSAISQPRRCARIHCAIGHVFILKNELSKAIEHYQQALEVSLIYLPSDHPDLIPIYSAIADCYSTDSNRILARENYEKGTQLVQPNIQ
ncbi:unnamed protein product [Rotaria magnacalcarata]|nr:unnamed protein product [Rotaria magnacalcarata]